MGSQWGHMARDCRVGGRIQEIGQDTEGEEEGRGDEHGHIGILEMGGSICAVDKNWRKDQDGHLAGADEWTQVKKRGVFVSPHLKHSNANMRQSQEWACAPRRKTSQVF